MSSSSYLDSLRFAIRQINLYGGLLVFIAGLFGELLNIVVFTTLKTFRKTACSFYLITTSVANLGIVIAIFLRVVYDGSNLGLSYTSLLCKFRFFLTEYAGFISLTSMCLATFDQFMSMTTYRRWSSLRFAHRLITFTCIVSVIGSVFTFIYYDSNLNRCIVTNAVYLKYYTYFHTLIMFGILPLAIMIIFSFLAFFKIRTIASRQIHIVRLSRDRQLTAMTLFHVLFIVITSLPFIMFFSYMLIINITDPVVISQHQLIYTVAVIFYYMSFSCSFYIYCSVSKRFRKQVTYVLINIHLNRWRRRVNRINNNQIIAYPMEIINEHRRKISILPDDIALY